MRAEGVTDDCEDREVARQRWLLQALAGVPGPFGPTDMAWLAGSAARQQRGLRIYQAHAAATAARALAAAYPTVQSLLGEPAFAALAQALWHAAPPMRGDLAAWGDALPDWMAADAQLAGEPYLPDLARLEWALHLASRAASDTAPVTGLELLASADPAALHVRLRAGHAVLCTGHPVHTLWTAHRSDAPDRFAPARDALVRRQREAVRVVRRGLAVELDRIDAATAAFEQDLLRGTALATALDAAAPGFDVEAWLVDSLRRDTLAAVELRAPG